MLQLQACSNVMDSFTTQKIKIYMEENRYLPSISIETDYSTKNFSNRTRQPVILWIHHLYVTYTVLSGSGSPSLNRAPFCSLQSHSALTRDQACPGPMPWPSSHRGPMFARPCHLPSPAWGCCPHRRWGRCYGCKPKLLARGLGTRIT